MAELKAAGKLIPDQGGADQLDPAALAKRQTASTYLKELAAIGILREHKMGREKVFLNPAFIDLLKRE